MKAAVIREVGAAPRYEEFPDPSPLAGETSVRVSAAAVVPLALLRAGGAAYGAAPRPPFVPGVDGVGRTEDGRRVYFSMPRPPYGSLGERVPVPADRLIPLPDGLDDVTAAAAANAGMSCWVPLTTLAPIRPGESVLVHGATGTSGRMAVQVARHLGAAHVIATGRDPAALAAVRSLGADEVVPLDGAPDLSDRLRRLARATDLGVVLDYLWGPPAATLLTALGGPEAPRGPRRIRFVQIGSLAGPTVPLDAALLRSSGVELLGSGLGSSSPATLAAGIRDFLAAFPGAGFRVDTEVRPLSEIERHWGRTGGARRLVFSVP